MQSYILVDFVWWYRLHKIPPTLQPFIATLDHHYAHDELHPFVFESYAPVHIPPSEANGSSQPGVEVIQNGSGYTIEHAGVSRIDIEVVDA